jgi:hypothetical protein
MKKSITILLILIGTATSLVSNGQTFEVSDKGMDVVIKGTSSLHDWEMDLTNINCGVQFKQEGSLLKSIENVSFSAKETDLKSESSLMDKKAYDALKTETYPEIKFSSVSTSDFIVENNKFKGTLKGKLNVAGQTRDVVVPFSGTIIDNNTINVTGSTDLNMSSFNIVPPTAMLGALKTGDKITVSFNLQLVQKNQYNVSIK